MLQEKIKEDLTKAQKERNSIRVSVLRMVKSEFKNKEIELRPENKEFTEEDALTVLQKEAKKRKESIETYESAGRNDLAEQEKAELTIIEEYLPEQMDRNEVEKIVDEIISKMDNPQFGQVMGQVMGRLKGQADGKIVNEVVKQKLT